MFDLRLSIYLVLLLLWSSTWKDLVEALINERSDLIFQESFLIKYLWSRKTTKRYPDQWSLTLKYCKAECKTVAIWILLGCVGLSLVLFANPFLSTTKYQLPIDFMIILLPIDEKYSLNWFLNYFYQLLLAILVCVFFYSYVALTLIFMNHSCWGIDISIQLIKELNDKIEYKIPKNSLLRKKIIAKQVKLIVEMTYRVEEWRRKVQSLLSINFLVEFSVASFFLCLCIYKVSFNPFGSMFTIIFMYVVLCQLFVYCWMGSRVITRIQNLTSAVYDTEWYLLNLSQQKDLQNILTMAQNMRSYNGIFKSVSLDTFQKVNHWEFQDYRLSQISRHIFSGFGVFLLTVHTFAINL